MTYPINEYSMIHKERNSISTSFLCRRFLYFLDWRGSKHLICDMPGTLVDFLGSDVWALCLLSFHFTIHPIPDLKFG